MSGVEGYMYPNEITLNWSVLIVLYPYITGLVAGAFILASLVRIFNVKAVAPTYRLALLTALSFLLVAPLPLQLHLGHPLRSPEMYFTPHSTSAMAMFGFVYLWYLMAVLVFEIWLDYRSDIVHLSQTNTGWKRHLYRAMTLGSDNISPRALAIDHKVGWIVTLVGIYSARIRRLHLRLAQSQSLVELAVDARGLPVLRHGLRHCSRSIALYGDFKTTQDVHRHALCRHDCDVPILYFHP